MSNTYERINLGTWRTFRTRLVRHRHVVPVGAARLHSSVEKALRNKESLRSARTGSQLPTDQRKFAVVAAVHRLRQLCCSLGKYAMPRISVAPED